MPTDQLERMQAQATRIGSANLTHSAQVVSEGLTQMRGATAPRLTLEFTAARILLPENSDAGVIARIERLERVGSIAPLPSSAPAVPTKTVQAVKNDVVKDEVKSTPKVEAIPEKQVPAAAPKKSVAAQPVAGMDLVGLRRLWPEVIA